ncbi:hypothetical protein EVAR_73657_1 [Eumeta japonica]|uniref:Uncharacterized protein n=1 Tax=Eumeta variegata TaxID=151549 RepID=A0A4C1TQH7_EUMVA|nr:hypothetical protein EVAR_73657_1 [Eumeta japonica]
MSPHDKKRGSEPKAYAAENDCKRLDDDVSKLNGFGCSKFNPIWEVKLCTPRHLVFISTTQIGEAPLLRNSQAISKTKNEPLSAPYACAWSVTSFIRGKEK